MAVQVPTGYNLRMAKQDDYIKTALRIPRALHSQLTASAEQKGCSLNAEFVSRLEASLHGPMPQPIYLQTQLLARHLDLAVIARTVAEIPDAAIVDPASMASMKNLRRATNRHLLPEEDEALLNSEHRKKFHQFIAELQAHQPPEE